MPLESSQIIVGLVLLAMAVLSQYLSWRIYRSPMPRPRKIEEAKRIRAWEIAHPRMPLLPETSPRSHLDLPNSIGVGSLLVTVVAVIITPPFLLKVALLALSSLGFFYFARKSHWTHSWPEWAKYGSALPTVGILCAIAIPQLTLQWRAEHPKPVASQPSSDLPLNPNFQAPQSPSAGVVGVGVSGKKATLDDVHINGFGSTEIQNNAGELNLKGGSSVSGGRVGIDNQNPHAKINITGGSTVSGGKAGIVNRGPEQALIDASKIQVFVSENARLRMEL